MTKANLKYTTAVAVASLAASIFAPSTFAATNVNINHNGAKSTNVVVAASSNKTTVNQTNNTVVSTNVSAKSNTVGNTVKNNTGGSSTVTTGNATTKVGVTVGGSTNSATLPNCDCDKDTTVDVNHNGAKSKNGVVLLQSNKLKVSQNNNALVLTNVDAKANTGKNKAKGNTDGDTSVTSGHANTEVTVGVTGASNELN